MALFMLEEQPLFPPVELADDDGLLAVGGDLSVKRLYNAYRCGIFPWYTEGQPVLWWSPDPRFVIFPEKLKVASSLRRILKAQRFDVTFDQDFHGVIDRCCRIPRKEQNGTWITDEMIEAYCRFHKAGYAHSVEVWRGRRLVGGLYGVAIGQVFFGESMFSAVANASKVGFVQLVESLAQAACVMIDCQVHTPHLERMGAELISRAEFLNRLNLFVTETAVDSWTDMPGLPGADTPLS